MNDQDEVDEFDTVDPIDSAFLPEVKTSDEPTEEENENLYDTVDLPPSTEDPTPAEGHIEDHIEDTSDDDEASDPFATWEE